MLGENNRKGSNTRPSSSQELLFSLLYPFTERAERDNFLNSAPFYCPSIQIDASLLFLCVMYEDVVTVGMVS
jgi:hypothetical protein